MRREPPNGWPITRRRWVGAVAEDDTSARAGLTIKIGPISPAVCMGMLGCSFGERKRLDEDICRDTQPCMEPPNHRQGEWALPIEHLRDPSTAAKIRL
jgi:hypothetical protein